MKSKRISLLMCLCEWKWVYLIKDKLTIFIPAMIMLAMSLILLTWIKEMLTRLKLTLWEKKLVQYLMLPRKQLLTRNMGSHFLLIRSGICFHRQMSLVGNHILQLPLLYNTDRWDCNLVFQYHKYLEGDCLCNIHSYGHMDHNSPDLKESLMYHQDTWNILSHIIFKWIKRGINVRCY